MPPAWLGQRERGPRGPLGAPQPAFGELQRRAAPEAAEQEPLTAAVHGDRRRARELLGRRLEPSAGELGAAEVEERQRALRVADPACAVVVQQRPGRLARAGQVAARARPQQGREPAGTAVVVPDVRNRASAPRRVAAA